MKKGVKEQMNAKRLQQAEICDGVRTVDGKLLLSRTRTLDAPRLQQATKNGGDATTVVSNGAAAARRSPSDVEKGIAR